MTDTPDTTEIVAEAIVQTAKEWDGRIDSWTALELAKDTIETYNKALDDAGFVVVKPMVYGLEASLDITKEANVRTPFISGNMWEEDVDAVVQVLRQRGVPIVIDPAYEGGVDD